MVRSLNPSVIAFEKYFSSGKIENVDDGLTIQGNCQLKKTVINGALPIKFKKVVGNFIISNNFLTTLEGCPNIVTNTFDCSNNNLDSLGGCPKNVGDLFKCNMNPLTSLAGLPNAIQHLRFVISYDKNLPLMRLIGARNVRLAGTADTDYHLVNQILNDYILLWQLEAKPKKLLILEFQQELIKKGFIGNASW
jgi:hypothetical protein